MPAFTEMLLTDALPDARGGLIAGDRRAEKIASRHRPAGFRECKQNRHRDAADMHHAMAVNVIDFESLNHSTVDERSVRRCKPPIGAPHSACAARFQFRKSVCENLAPRLLRCVKATADRVEN